MKTNKLQKITFTALIVLTIVSVLVSNLHTVQGPTAEATERIVDVLTIGISLNS